MFKKILAAFVSAAMMLAMSSCERNNNEQVSETAVMEDGKKIVKIYASYSPYDDLYSDIASFNRKSSAYEVQLTEYQKEFEEPLKRLNTDITTGNPPDILIIDNTMPLKSYNDKGLFADLYEFIDSDPDMKREDFIGSFLKANETDGKLFKISSDFYIETVIGKTSLVGEKQGRTAEEFFELAESYPDKKMFGSDVTKHGALSTFTLFGYSEYVDLNTGECHFNSSEFIRLLEFCSSFPNSADENNGENNFRFSKNEADLYNGNILVSADRGITHFGAIRQLEHGIFGEPVTFIGFPGVGGNGSVIRIPSSEYAIMSNAANKEGAWEFVKYILSEEYQDRIYEEKLMFPIRTSSLEKAAEEAKKGSYDGDKGEYVEPVWILNGEIIKLGVNTDEDNRRVFELIDSAVGASGFEVYVYDIITEEAAAYFSGQKSAKEVAEIIQNRVQNYLDESQ